MDHHHHQHISSSILRPNSRGKSSPARLYVVSSDPWSCNSGRLIQPNGRTTVTDASTWRTLSPSGARSPSIEAIESVSLPKSRLESPIHKSKVIASRDKESLLEEIIALKKALLEQNASLQRQKVYATNIEAENRKLEKDLEELENGSSKTSRTGNVCTLRAKVQGLKTKVSDLQTTCNAQQEELASLRKDIRVTRAKDLELEKDLFAEEIERLQKVVKGSTILQSRLYSENKQLHRLKDRSIYLEAANQRLETERAGLQASLQKVSKEAADNKHRANESLLRAKKNQEICRNLQEHVSLLARLLEREKGEKHSLQKKISALQDEVQKLVQTAQLSGSTQSRAELNDIGGQKENWDFIHANSKILEPDVHNELTHECQVNETVSSRNLQIREEVKPLQFSQSMDQLIASNDFGDDVEVDETSPLPVAETGNQMKEINAHSDIGQEETRELFKGPMVPRLNLQQVSGDGQLELLEDIEQVSETDSSSAKECIEERGEYNLQEYKENDYGQVTNEHGHHLIKHTFKTSYMEDNDEKENDFGFEFMPGPQEEIEIEQALQPNKEQQLRSWNHIGFDLM